MNDQSILFVGMFLGGLCLVDVVGDGGCIGNNMLQSGL